MLSSSLFSLCSVFLVFVCVFVDAEILLNYDHDLKHLSAKRFDIKGAISLNCQVKHKGHYTQKWEKDNVEFKPDEKDRVTQNNEGDSYAIRITKAVEDDAGVYSCVIFDSSGELERGNITLMSKYRVKTPDNLNFVEGEKLRITCMVHGNPAPAISWKVGNTTYEESDGRIILEKDTEKGVPNAILMIEEAEMGDRGEYICIGTPKADFTGSNDGITVTDKTMVRIKDKYAALWPFLGICAEVFILCAIILIYEKKRNKAELEESDTDQSPDQKNTPDHGKDSNLRHRQQ